MEQSGNNKADWKKSLKQVGVRVAGDGVASFECICAIQHCENIGLDFEGHLEEVEIQSFKILNVAFMDSM